MKYILLFICVLFFISCGSVKVSYDHDKQTDFSNYSTYGFYTDMETGLSELDNKRLLKYLDIALQSKGLLFSEEPDFLINVKSELFQGARNNSVGVGLGGSGSNIGGGVSIGIPVGKPKVERQIQFDFVDTRKDMLFWQAISVSTFKENRLVEEREQKMQALMEKVLDKYPPKTKK